MSTPAVVRVTTLVPLGPEEAFSLFTDDAFPDLMSVWWGDLLVALARGSAR